MKKTIIIGIIFLLSLVAVNAATVSHSASEVTPGSFQVGSYNFPGILTVGTALFVNASSGNVGIGTTSPSQKLHIYDNNGNIANNGSVYIQNINDGGALRVKNNGQSYHNDRWIFDVQNAGGSVLRVLGNGNVGIGTTNPQAPLEIYRNDADSWIRFHDPGQNHFTTGLDTSNAAYVIATGVDLNTPLVTIKTTGNVGIGTTTPSYKLDVNGNLRAYGITDASDIRLKKNINTISNALEKVSKLRGVNFEWKDEDKGEGTQLGLIAQEVEKVFPEAVSKDDKGYKSIAYGKLAGAFVEAVKELKSENDALKQENQEIKDVVCEIKPTADICQ